MYGKYVEAFKWLYVYSNGVSKFQSRAPLPHTWPKLVLKALAGLGRFFNFKAYTGWCSNCFQIPRLGFFFKNKKPHLRFALHPSWLIEMVPNPWLLLRQVFIKELGCLLGFTSDQIPAPLAHAHPTQVLKTGTKRLSQKSNTRTILIETATKYWFLLNVVSREKDRPQGLGVQNLQFLGYI